ncbi:hypothetical protein NQ318_019344 [Aromia moschata]|uniref:Dynein regulatory complex protein 9 n=1 Tax=Aromia moschata TaxID=1265417 RepID=A0AAV8YCU4_9CUCU|nr:hypothetical protein NQ318_019344 [Aromia moschata]
MGSEDHAEYRINSVVSSYAKLAKDINTLVCILRETSDEIFAKGTFTMLKNSSHAILRMYEDEKQLMETFKNNARALKQLRRLREEERLANIRTMEETNGNIQKLRFEVEDVLVYSKYEATYFENWERTRREQNTIVCKQKENIPGYIISETRNKIDAENRCHVELENYIEESKNDYLDEIQYWMRHYDDETEKREAEMLNLKADIEKLMEDRAALKQKFDSHKAEIDDWVDYKTAKKEKEDRERLELWAAIKIQAWWRGTMVRKKLGPYRKKKGKGKDKGKGKGKKK